MLDTLHEYASTWHLLFNAHKTKVVVFNRCYTGEKNRTIDKQERDQLKKKLAFTYNSNKKAHGVMQYKTYETPIAFRVSQGRKALATWIRRCNTWMLDANVMITLFKTGAMPALEYGVGLWGVGFMCKHMTTNAWKGTEKFWLSVARYILHAPVTTPIAAITGDLEWLPFSIRAGYQAAQFLARVSKLNDESLVRKAMCVQRELVNGGKPCWLGNFRTMLHSLKDSSIDSLSNTWIHNGVDSRFTTRTMRIKRLRFDTVSPIQTDATGAAGQPREEMVGLDRLVEEALVRTEKLLWEKELAREVAKSGREEDGGNKLRTYTLFKSHICREPYLSVLSDSRKRALMFKFRSGIAPLRIETGRYEMVKNPDSSKKSRVRRPVDERICFCCGTGVEDEFHFLCECPLYADIRMDLVSSCMYFNSTLESDSNPGLTRINCDNPREFFRNIMGTQDCTLIRCLADYIWSAFKVRETQLQALNV
jgi:hypothetical protein